MRRSSKTQGELDALVGVLTEPALVIDSDGAVAAANAAARRLLGDRAAGRLQDLARASDRAESLLRSWLRTSKSLPGRLVLDTDAGPQDLRVDGVRLSDGTGALVRLRESRDATQAFGVLNQKIATLGREVSRRMRAERRLAAQNRLLELTARGLPLATVLDAIARFVEDESAEGTRASISLLEGDTLRHGAAPSLPPVYNAAVDGLRIGPAVGSCGTAAFTGKPVIVSDIESDPLWADVRDLALRHGLRACWSHPVTGRDGNLLATVAHYHPTPRAPTDDDQALATMATYLVGIAIERHNREQALHARASELADANARTNEFLAMLGHELRNPLSPMATTLELLRDGDPGGPERDEYLDILTRQLGLVRRLVDDLLDIARVTRGKVELRPTRLDLRQIVAAVRGEYQGDTRITTALPEEPVWSYVDAERLQQVVGNLVHNARKFTPDDGHIRVSLATEGKRAVVRVEDDGQGIKKSELPHIFQLFSQGRPDPSRALGGLGIGLTLVQSLVEQHGGTVRADSAGPGRGAVFEVGLPTCEAPVETVEAPPAPSAGALSSGLDILVVDDNEDGAVLLAGLLERWGHHARVAHDGPSALDSVASAAPQVVVLDIGLPGLDGCEVARRIRTVYGLSTDACTLIALTGYGQKSDQQRAKDAGFDDFMVKPVDPPTLKALIESRPPRRHTA